MKTFFQPFTGIPENNVRYFGSLPCVYCLLPLETSASKIYPFLTSASGDYLPVAPVLVPATGKIISGWFAIALSHPVPLYFLQSCRCQYPAASCLLKVKVVDAKSRLL